MAEPATAPAANGHVSDGDATAPAANGHVSDGDATAPAANGHVSDDSDDEMNVNAGFPNTSEAVSQAPRLEQDEADLLFPQYDASQIVREVSVIALAAHKRLLIRGDVANAWQAFALADQAAALYDKVIEFHEAQDDEAEPVAPTYSPRVASLLERLKNDRQATREEASDYAFAAIGAALPAGYGSELLRASGLPEEPEPEPEPSRWQRFEWLTGFFCNYSFDNFIAALDHLGSING